MSSLLLLNGSPRGKAGNSAILLGRIGEGWSEEGGSSQTLHLARPDDFRQAVPAFGEADAVVLAMPLYTDAMPGLVKEYIEALEPLAGRAGDPRLGFVVQSGFSEALHSRYLERYLEKLASRLGCAYAGTLVKGGGEAIRQMPDSANRTLFERSRSLGRSLARDGRFNAHLLSLIAGTERLSAPLSVLASLAVRLPVAQWYWDRQLKANGAFERRFARPYA
jgi:hypothetical protein